MRPGSTRASAALALLALAAGAASCAAADGNTANDGEEIGMQEAVPNRLTEAEAAEGFKLLFDGRTLEEWRGYGREDVPGAWSVEDGAIAFTPGEDGGDLISRDTYASFDFRFEWRISPGGNSGVFFAVTEDQGALYESGPEMQVLDNAGHPDGADPKTSAGSNFGLYAPIEDVTRPVGEWNEARIVRRGNLVEHWLNGVKIVEYELGSDAWKTLVADSKFAAWPAYGTSPAGHLGLQDHGDRVWYRSLRVRRLGRTATGGSKP